MRTRLKPAALAVGSTAEAKAQMRFASTVYKTPLNDISHYPYLCQSRLDIHGNIEKGSIVESDCNRADVKGAPNFGAIKLRNYICFSTPAISM